MKHLIATFTLVFSSLTLLEAAHKPNIVLILADDMGYGDIHAFNPT